MIDADHNELIRCTEYGFSGASFFKSIIIDMIGAMIANLSIELTSASTRSAVDHQRSSYFPSTFGHHIVEAPLNSSDCIVEPAQEDSVATAFE